MTAAQASAAGKHQFFEKLLPAAARTPHAHRSVFGDKGTIAAGRGRVLQVDRKRFDACVDHLARALFFDAYQQKWSLPIVVISPNFFNGIASDQVVPHQPTLGAVQVSRQVLAAEPVRGENHEVFRYRLRFDEADGSYALAAIFYDCFEVYSFSSAQLAEAAL